MNPNKQALEQNDNLEIHQVRKTCFMATPLGADDSAIRKSVNGLIDAVITPVLAEYNIELIAPHRVLKPGSITKQVIRYLLNADLVIANLTDLNPNVMYELAVRHAKRLPIITIARSDTRLPFDVAAERTIFFDDDMAGVMSLKKTLTEMIPEALSDATPENPIYDGQESLIIKQSVHRTDSDGVKEYIIDQMEQLSSQIRTISNQQRSFSDILTGSNANHKDLIAKLSPATNFQGVLLRFSASTPEEIDSVLNFIQVAIAFNDKIGTYFFGPTDVSVGMSTLIKYDKSFFQEMLEQRGARMISYTGGEPRTEANKP